MSDVVETRKETPEGADEAVTALTTAFLRKDRAADARRYWQDVHGVLFAHCPGLDRYYQHHFSAPSAHPWPRRSGIESFPRPEDAPSGIAEMSFRAADDVQTFMSSPEVADYTYRDEQNLADGSYAYFAPDPGPRTYLDRSGDNAPNGNLPDRRHPAARYFVGLRRRDDVSHEEFHKAVRDHWVPRVMSIPTLVKLRVHFLAPFDASAWTSPHVSHDREAHQQYQVLVEVAFTGEFESRAFLRSDDAIRAAESWPEFIGAQHTFPISATYTLRYGGKPTLAGLRGASVAELMWQTGAANQAEDAVLQRLFMTR